MYAALVHLKKNKQFPVYKQLAEYITLSKLRKYYIFLQFTAYSRTCCSMYINEKIFLFDGKYNIKYFKKPLK